MSAVSRADAMFCAQDADEQLIAPQFDVASGDVAQQDDQHAAAVLDPGLVVRRGRLLAPLDPAEEVDLPGRRRSPRYSGSGRSRRRGTAARWG